MTIKQAHHEITKAYGSFCSKHTQSISISPPKTQKLILQTYRPPEPATEDGRTAPYTDLIPRPRNSVTLRGKGVRTWLAVLPNFLREKGEGERRGVRVNGTDNFRLFVAVEVEYFDFFEIFAAYAEK